MKTEARSFADSTCDAKVGQYSSNARPPVGHAGSASERMANRRMRLMACGVGVLAAAGVVGAILVTAETPSAAAPFDGLTSAADVYQADTSAQISLAGFGELSAVPADYSVSQQNAIGKAKEYLAISGFSRSGLISQLKYEGFSDADATAAVDSLGVNWNAQAVKKAKEYLAISSFSHSGLVEQLVFDGFTNGQAEYGVTGAGL